MGGGYRLIDLTGKVIGTWTVIKRAPSRDNHTFWVCRCICGTEREVNSQALRLGQSNSCGCTLVGETHPRYKHGLAKHPLARVWATMRHRCESPKCESYNNYGGRGIKVCPQWQSLPTFIADIERLLGPRPKGMTLDRINNDGNYQPGNVRWATWKTQMANRRPPRKRKPIPPTVAEKRAADFKDRIQVDLIQLIPTLSPRDREILTRKLRGESNAEIGRAIGYTRQRVLQICGELFHQTYQCGKYIQPSHNELYQEIF